MVKEDWAMIRKEKENISIITVIVLKKWVWGIYMLNCSKGYHTTFTGKIIYEGTIENSNSCIKDQREEDTSIGRPVVILEVAIINENIKCGLPF